MVSDDTIDLLATCTSSIGEGNDLSRAEFTEEELRDIKSSAFPEVLEFLNETGYSVCRNCQSQEGSCHCTEPNPSRAYKIDLRELVEHISDVVEEYDGYSDAQLEQESDSHWRLQVESKNFGQVIFEIVSNSDGVREYSPDLEEKRFPVCLVRSEWVSESNLRFFWRQLLDRETLDQIESQIRDVTSPLNEAVCKTGSELVEKSRNSIEYNLREFLESQGYHTIDLRDHVSDVLTDVEEQKIEFAVMNEEEDIIILCDCESNEGQLHFHLIAEDSLQSTKETICETAAEKMKRKLSNLEEYNQKEKNLQSRTKAAAMIIAAVGFTPVAKYIPSILNINIPGISNFGGLLELLLYFVGIALVLILLQPAIMMTLFSWDIRGYRARFRSFF